MRLLAALVAAVADARDCGCVCEDFALVALAPLLREGACPLASLDIRVADCPFDMEVAVFRPMVLPLAST